MIRSGQTADFRVGRTAWIACYSFFVLLLQAQLVTRMPYPALRTDLLLPLMLPVALEWPPITALLWASFWGFIIDNFSGEFWGLHVGSYAAAICLVNMASDKFDCNSPVYQMGLVGVCALGQSVALGLFQSFQPMDLPSLTALWTSLGIRTLLSMTMAPFLIYPLLSSRGSS
ncbi:MAG: hypothetical protein AAGU11_16360 [Syntrophobacteraceae bacterium]